jgi:hypothetical protein
MNASPENAEDSSQARSDTLNLEAVGEAEVVRRDIARIAKI